MLVVRDDLWRGMVESEGFNDMKTEFKRSYSWDRLIEHFADDLLSGGMFDMHSKQVTDNELALVTMTLEPRRNRVIISEAFLEFLQDKELGSAARVVQGREGHAFLFTIGSSDDREFRARELAFRCLVVRGKLPNTHTVVGIATDRPGVSSRGYSSDIVYLHMPEWTGEDERGLRGIQDDLGYFNQVDWSRYQQLCPLKLMRSAKWRRNSPSRSQAMGIPFGWRDARQRRGGFSRVGPRPWPRRGRRCDRGADGVGQSACTGIDIGTAG